MVNTHFAAIVKNQNLLYGWPSRLLPGLGISDFDELSVQCNHNHIERSHIQVHKNGVRKRPSVTGSENVVWSQCRPPQRRLSRLRPQSARIVRLRSRGGCDRTQHPPRTAKIEKMCGPVSNAPLQTGPLSGPRPLPHGSGYSGRPLPQGSYLAPRCTEEW